MKKIYIFLILFVFALQAKADHVWIVQNLQFIESPAGSGIYDLRFSYSTDGTTTNNIYYEIYVVEDGCTATDGFSYSRTGCINYNNTPSRTDIINVDANIPFCPGKRYSAVLFTRRLTGGAAPTNCGVNGANDRANDATPLGSLTKYPSIRPGDPATIWSGAPLNYNAMNTYPAGSGNDGPNRTNYDGNWAYIYTTQTGNGDPLWNFNLSINTEDCISSTDASIALNSVSNPDIGSYNLGTKTVRCGSLIDLRYSSNNSCGVGFPGNTFELIDNSTVIDVVNYSSSTVTPMGVGVNVNGRFQAISAMKSGYSCSNGVIDLRFQTASCNTAKPVIQDLRYNITVLYPTSNFVQPTKVYCSDVCGQDIVMRGSDPEWKATTGINMGNSTTLPPAQPISNMSYIWTGQVCTPIQTGATNDCLDGDGNVYVNNCASCGVYPITYSISNGNCSDCSTTTTKNVQIVSPRIVSVTNSMPQVCGAVQPQINFQVVECNPTTGGTTTIPYTGSGQALWERSDQPGVYYAIGSPALIVQPGTTITFTPHFRNSGCASCNAVGTPVTVTSTATPAVPTNANTTVNMCQNGTSPVLTATCVACPSGGTQLVRWYSNPLGGSIISTGASFTPINNTSIAEQGSFKTNTPGLYTFWAECVCNGCPSAREAYTIQVVAQPSIPITTSIGIVCEFDPAGSVAFSQLFPGSDPNPANFTLGGGSTATITGNGIVYNGPGCNSVTYTYNNEVCPVVGPITSFVQVSEDVLPSFDIQAAVCWSSGNNVTLTPTINSPAYTSAVTRMWSVTGPATINTSNGQVVVTGAGTITVTLTETISYAACGTRAAGTCTKSVTQSIISQNGTALDVNFNFSTNEPCIGQTVTLTPTTPSPPGIFSGTGVTSGTGTGTFVAPSCGTFAVTYTRTSANGCVNTLTKNISTDKTPPTLNLPTNTSANCDGTGNTAGITTWLAGYSVTDNCGVSSSSSSVVSTVNQCGGTKTITYQFVASDACSNTSEAFRTFTITDNTAPVITNSAPTNISVACDGNGNATGLAAWLNSNGGLLATNVVETCGAYTWKNNFGQASFTAGTCPNTGVYSVNFWVVDDCGNKSNEVTRTYTIIDNTMPTITPPVNITVQCGDQNNNAIINNWLRSAITTDLCDPSVTVTTNFSAIPACGATSSITFTATDDCGNTETGQASIRVVDSIPPFFMVAPTDLNLNCGPSNATAITAWIAANGNAVAKDACDPSPILTVTAGTTVTSCPGNTTTPYTFTARDACGNNSITEIAYVNITDNTPPTLTLAPAPAPINCDSGTDIYALAIAGAVASDLCSSVTLSVSLVKTVSSCVGSATQTLRVIASDQCGNQTSATQDYQIIDTEGPEFTEDPIDLIVSCGDDIPTLVAAWLRSVTAHDHCSTVTIVTNNFNGDLPNACGGSRLVTWTATDDCGNVTTKQASLIVSSETTPPIFLNCPNNLTINANSALCSSNVVFSKPVATDCNLPVTVTQTAGPVSGSSFQKGTTNITFIATDACGNQATCNFNITVVDSTKPNIICPQNITVCNTNNTCGWVSDGAVNPNTMENCPGNTITYIATGALTATGSNTISGMTFPVGTTMVEYKIVDASGNRDSCKFSVLVNDCQVPTVTCPANITLACNSSTLAADILAWRNSVTRTDNCPGTTTLSSELFSSTVECPGTSIDKYRFVVTDAAGNTSVCFADIKIEDNTAPIIATVAIDKTVECDGKGNNAQLLSWLESNGGILTSEVTETCGILNVWKNNFGSVTFTPFGNCANQVGYYEVQFWVTDMCGNESNRVTKRFIIEDETTPTFSAPKPIILECGDNNNEAIVFSWLQSFTTRDTCSTVTVTNTYSALPTTCVAGSNMSTITFTATDACGNSTTGTSTITLVDAIKPVLMTTPMNLSLECTDPLFASKLATWVSTSGGAVAIDACDPTVTLTFISVDSTALCGKTYVKKYQLTATDDCGNSVSTFAEFRVFDTNAPVITPPSASNIVACSANVDEARNTWLNSVSAADGCGGAVNFTYSLVSQKDTCDGDDTKTLSTYLFTATDACGNLSTLTAKFTVQDIVSPVIVAPTSLSLTCGDNIGLAVTDWLDNYTVTEACQRSYTVTNSFDASTVNLCGSTTVVTWTVTDGCGASSTASSSIIIIPDVTPPTFINCPGNLNVNVNTADCQARVIYPVPVAQDCNEPVVIAAAPGNIPPGGVFPLGSTTVSFTATDKCGNTATCSFNIIVQDSQIPSIVCPSNYTVCNDNNTCTWLATNAVDPAINENCVGERLSYTITGATTASSPITGFNKLSTSSVVFQLGVSTVTYLTTDAAGNTASCSFTVTVNDCQKPVINCPTTLNLTCGAAGNADAIIAWLANVATPSDNCPGTVAVTNELLSTIDQCGATETRIYQFTATDAAGNTSTCRANVVITDTTPPIIATPASNLTVQCNGNNNTARLLGWLNTKGGAAATDACSAIITWTNNYSQLSNLCGETGSATVIFTATDECGNSATTSATFTIQDTSIPTLTPPANITLACGNESNNATVAAWLRSYSAYDSCGQVTVTNSTVVIPTTCVAGSNMTTITFTATDACGLTNTATATITIQDNQKPTIMVPPTDLVVECTAGDRAALIGAWTANFGGATTVDNCDNSVTLTFVAGAPSAQCGSTSTTLYTLTATDDCGNFIQRYANLIIIDRTPPVLTLPTATNTVACNGDIDGVRSTWFASASGLDGCGGAVTISHSIISISKACVGTNTVTTETHQFTATDACGNISTSTAVFNIEDTTKPTITAPANLIIACGQNNATAILNWLTRYTVVEACQSYTISNNYDGSIPDLCAGAPLTVTWTVTDGCGASNTATSQIIVTPDVTPPTFVNCPSSLTVNADVDLCNAQVIYSTPIATDCNAPSTVVLTSGIASGQTFPLGITTIVFTATDRCGNTTTCSFTITVLDSAIPSISCPSPLVERCADAGVCTWTSSADVNPLGIENCPGSAITYTITGATTASGNNSAAGTIFNLGESTVKYHITAANGQKDSCSFRVVIKDCEKPVITCPATLTLECADAGNATAITTWIASATATDNCTPAPVITNKIFSTQNTCGNTSTAIYIFTATDANGNTATCMANVVTTDNTNPTINTVAKDSTLSCDGNGNNTALLQWVLNNGGIKNSEVTETCGSFTWRNDFASSIFVTNPTCANDIGYYLINFWVVDQCGNESVKIPLKYIIEDTSLPKIEVPANLTLECKNPANSVLIANWLALAKATDACSSVTLINDYPGVSSTICGTSGGNIVTFTATDACGNVISNTASITINDTQIPIFTTLPASLTVQCDGLGNTTALNTWLSSQAGAIAVDSCSAAVTISNSLISNSPSCGGTSVMTYVFTATDACGNTAIANAQFIIKDTVSPTITVMPKDTIVNCDGLGNTVALKSWLTSVGNGGTATDVCGSVTWSNKLIAVTEKCGLNGVYTYAFIATDACNNSIRDTAIFTLQDTTKPVIVTPATNLSVNCNSFADARLIGWLNNQGGATATNACGDITWKNDFDTITPSCGATGAVTVTFTATDACGNFSTTTATFTIIDTIKPIWSILPQAKTLNCSADDITTAITAWLNTNGGGKATDNCSGVKYMHDYGSLSNGCSSGTGSALVTFTATDSCGNSRTAQAQISVRDVTPPAINIPAKDTMVSCDGVGNTAALAGWVANHGRAQAIDGCSNPITWQTIAMDTIKGCGKTISYLYGFTATDACGNVSAQTLARFSIKDTTAPIITIQPTNPIVECNGTGNLDTLNRWLSTHGGAIATDACSSIAKWEYVLINTNNACGSTGVKTYRFTASDSCGNKSSVEATFTIRDITAPTITAQAANLTVQCNGSSNSAQILAWLNNKGGATAKDTCGIITWTNNYGTIVGACGATGAVTVQFYATDQCGNISTTTATLTINDTVKPTWEKLPQNLTIVCDGTRDPRSQINSWLNLVGGAEAKDSCSLIAYFNNFTSLSGGCSPTTGLAIVTFTARDACGNETTAEATVTVIDNVAPIISTPARDTIVECNGSGNASSLTTWLNNNGGAVAIDDCSGFTWSNQLVGTTTGCGGTSIRTYAFIATDICGNTSVQTTAKFTIQDTTKPVITIRPSSLTVECDGRGNITQLNTWLNTQGGTGAASDICGNVSWSYVLLFDRDSCGVNTSADTYRFIVKDQCGNEVSDTATFRIKDTTAPTMVCCPDLTIALNENGIATITPDSLDCGSFDACSSSNSLQKSISKSSFSGVNIGVNPVTLTVTDACGNTNTCVVNVTVIENPSVGIAKRSVSLINNPNGSATVQYEINVQNYGDVTLDSLQVLDTLFNTFGGTCQPSIVTITSDNFIVNPSFNGIADFKLLIGSEKLSPGEKGSILITVLVDSCGSDRGPFANSAYAEAKTPSGAKISDKSQTGSNPDPNGDGIPDEDEPTIVAFSNVYNIGLSKNLVQARINTDGSFDIVYEFSVENFSSTDIVNIQVVDNLAAAFPSPCNITVNSLTSSEFAINNSYDGLTNFNLLLGTDDLPPGSGGNGGILLSIHVENCGVSNLGPFANNAFTSAVSTNGVPVSDQSVDGTEPDPDGNNIPNERSPTIVNFNENPIIGISKALSELPQLQADGSYNIEYFIRVENLGDINIDVNEVIDSLSVTFGAAIEWTLIGFQSEQFKLNALFDGVTNVNLIDAVADNTLAPNEDGGIAVNINVKPGAFMGPYLNSATVLANSPFGTPTVDTSDNGYNPDPDGDKIPNEAGENDPTPVILPCFVKIVCPALPDTIRLENDANWCQALLNLPNSKVITCAGVTDTIFEYKLTGIGATNIALNTWITGHPNNLEYKVGTTTITNRVRVSGVGADSCVIVVIVRDKQKPTAICKDVRVFMDANCMASISAKDVDGGSTDNCAIDTILISFNGDPFRDSVKFTQANVYPANNIITLLVRDIYGNESFCTADIDVLDTIKPKLTVPPAPLVMNCDGNGNVSSLTAWLSMHGGMQVTDNCTSNNQFTWDYSLITYTPGCGKTSSALYRFTARDNYGNTFSDTARFTIIDVTPPTVVCCPTFSINLDQNGLASIDVRRLDCGSFDACSNSLSLQRSLSKYNFNSSNIGQNIVWLYVADACGNIDSCMVNVLVTEMPSIGVAKRAVSVVNNPNGSASVQYEINVQNYGDVELDSIRVSDNLSTTFAGCTIDSTVLSSDRFIINPAYNGTTDTNLIIGNTVLPAGDKGSILVSVVLKNCSSNGPFANTAYALATSPSGAITRDTSMNGSNPDPNGDGNPSEKAPTIIFLESTPLIGVAKNVVKSNLNTDGSMSVTYEFNIENFGTTNLNKIQVFEDFSKTFGAPCSVQVVSRTSDQFAINPAFNGLTDTLMLTGTDDLSPGENGAVLVEVLITQCGANLGPFNNQVTVSAATPSGDTIKDLSVNGTDADPNEDGLPIESSPTVVSFAASAALGIAKRVSELPVLNADGTYTLQYEFRLQNYGQVDVNVKEVNDVLSTTFALADTFKVIGIESEQFAINDSFNGVTKTNLIDSTQANILKSGVQAAIRVKVNVAPGNFDGPYVNTAIAKGITSLGLPISDVSTLGSNPDPNGDGLPLENTLTPVSLPCYLVLVCPSTADTIVVPNDANWCRATINIPAYKVNTCAGIDATKLEYKLVGIGAEGVLTNTWITGQPSNLAYKVGMTTLYVRASIPARPDLGFDSCTTKIIVLDKEVPKAVCKDIQVILDGNCQFILKPSMIDGGSSDNCGIVSYKIAKDGVTFVDSIVLTTADLDPSNTSITLLVTDAAGNTSICVADIEALDFSNPMVICGQDITVNTAPNSCHGIVPNVLPNINLTDNCYGIRSMIQYPSPGVLFGTRAGDSIEIFVVVEDSDFNKDTCSLFVYLKDIEKPIFTNCPQPPVIIDAPRGWCSAFVNFGPIAATDNCGTVTVTQIDTTKLSSGKLFPIGLSLLRFEVRDESGNVDTCELKVIVNDFHEPPTFTCPKDTVLLNTPDQCGAIVRGLNIKNLADNCGNSLSVTYEVKDVQNNVIFSGLTDASGLLFPIGKSTVTYKVTDQPILLITEIIQDGTITGVEVTNFGPADYDITCLQISAKGNTLDSTFVVPEGTVLKPGMTYTHTFGAVNTNLPMIYTISILDRVIDGVALNGATPINFAWSGLLAGPQVVRYRLPDTDQARDFKVATICNPSNFGMLNVGLPTFAPSNVKVGLQSEVPSTRECSFMVTITDKEAPSCAEFAYTTINNTSPVTIDAGACIESTIIVGPSFNIGDIDVVGLKGTFSNMGALSFTLKGPDGTQATLISGVCSGTPNFNISLDDQAASALSSAPCSPLGGGNSFQSMEQLKRFFGKGTAGTWTLSIQNTSAASGVLTEWGLKLGHLVPYSAQDSTLNNDVGRCGAEYNWVHPSIFDNCCTGTMTVTYDHIKPGTTNTPIKISVQPGTAANRFFAVGTTIVTYTITDVSGNTSYCSFVVKVLDTEAPIINDTAACKDLVYQLAPGKCRIVPIYPTPIFSDNCGDVMVTYDPAPGTPFEIGTTMVFVTVKDSAGNEDKCKFNVEVKEFVPPVGSQIACRDQINLSLGADCKAFITPEMVLAGEGYGCLDRYVLTLSYQGTVIGTNTNNTNCVTKADIGKTITVTVCSPDRVGNCCTTSIKIELKLIPEIKCPKDTIIACNGSIEPEYTGIPEVLTCEDSYKLTYFDDFTSFTACLENVAVIKRTWKIVDESGNTATCMQTIRVKSFNLADIVWPIDHNITTFLKCDDVAKDPSLLHPDKAGYPTINGRPISDTGDGLCMVSWAWDDQKLNACQGSYEILRKWFVRNMCKPVKNGENPIEHYQIIKVVDNSAPIILCPKDTVISVNAWSCKGELDITNLITTKDNCGGVKKVSVLVSLGSVVELPNGRTIITNLPVGTHNVVISARDYCSNIASCGFKISVVDKISPVAVCLQKIVYGITQGGKSKLFATQLNNQSYDECTEVKLEVYRLEESCDTSNINLTPRPYVDICCADISKSPIMVVLRVWDNANRDSIIGNEGDNYSECMVEVKVEEKIPLRLICPPAVTITCDQNIKDLKLTGTATVLGICTSDSVKYTDEARFNQCGTGTVIRTWYLKGNNKATCTQEITVKRVRPFDPITDVTWPIDWTGSCIDSIPQAKPIIKSGICDLIGYTVYIDTFKAVDGVCYKILKGWVITDWCRYDTNNPDAGGRWTKTQIIKISDKSAPVIATCSDTLVVGFTTNDCANGEVQLSPMALDTACGVNALITWNYTFDTNNDGTVNSSGSAIGNKPTVKITNVPIGFHKIVWTVNDGCGNFSTCTQILAVKDVKAPTPYCNNNLATVLMPVGGSVTLTAKSFDKGSFDNCTPSSQLRYSFSGDSIVPARTFTCADIRNGISQTLDVKMWVYDANGNRDFCIVKLNLQDNNNTCPDQNVSFTSIVGRTATEDGQSVNNATITIATNYPEYPINGSTNEFGRFELKNNPMGYDYQLGAARTTDYREGVNTLDLVTIQRHILGITKFDSPYKHIAADIDNSERITVNDIVIMRKLILGIVDTFPNASWRFVDKKYKFLDSNNPFPYEGRLYMQNLDKAVFDADFVAVKIGDVDQTWKANNVQTAKTEVRTNNAFKIQVVKSQLENGTYMYDFVSTEDLPISGMQLGISNTDTRLDKGGILSMTKDNFHSLHQGTKFAWVSDKVSTPLLAGNTLFSITSANGKISIADFTSSEVYLSNLTSRPVVLELVQSRSGNVWEVKQNEPNPFKVATNISFVVGRSADVTLTITTTAGQLVYTKSRRVVPGEHRFEVTSNDIPVSGIYIYEVTDGVNKVMRKMIKID